MVQTHWAEHREACTQARKELVERLIRTVSAFSDAGKYRDAVDHTDELIANTRDLVFPLAALQARCASLPCCCRPWLLHACVTLLKMQHASLQGDHSIQSCGLPEQQVGHQ